MCQLSVAVALPGVREQLLIETHSDFCLNSPTGTIMKMTSEEGSAANYQPARTLVVREDRSNTPGSYVLNGRGHVVNKKGEVIQTAIKPGTHVRIYYANAGDSRIVDRVVVD